MSTLKAVLRLTPTVRALLLELLISFCPAMSQVSSHVKPSEHNAPHLVPQAVPVAEAYFSPQLLRELASIRDAALRDDYTYQQLAHLTENIGPRISGSPQSQAAVEYVAEELRKLGLEVRLEQVKAPHWHRGTGNADRVEFPGQAPGTTQKVVLTALGGSTSTPAGGITTDVVVVKGCGELSARGRE